VLAGEIPIKPVPSKSAAIKEIGKVRFIPRLYRARRGRNEQGLKVLGQLEL